MKEINYFIVSSRGLTATTWFSHALNKHPLIFCCHGRDKPERSIETEELLQSIEYRKDRLAFEQRQREMGILEYLDILKKASSGEMVVGNIHGFVLVELIDKLSKAGLYGEIPIANMVRNPITFIESYTALVCHRKHDYPEKFNAEHLPRANENRELLNSFGLTDLEDIEIYGFVEACQAVVKMSRELNTDGVITILMEKIVSDKKYFSDIAGYLTGGRCSFDKETLTNIFTQGKMNPHRDKIKSTNNDEKSSWREKPYMIWTKWPKNKKMLFRHFINEKQIRNFISLGYDIEFVEEV